MYQKKEQRRQSKYSLFSTEEHVLVQSHHLPHCQADHNIRMLPYYHPLGMEVVGAVSARYTSLRKPGVSMDGITDWQNVNHLGDTLKSGVCVCVCVCVWERERERERERGGLCLSSIVILWKCHQMDSQYSHLDWSKWEHTMAIISNKYFGSRS